jgi:phospholipid-binding lipoprotein MlaA
VRNIEIKKLAISILTTSLLCSCANPQTPNDPYQSFNRPVYAMNNTIDRYLLRPIAKVYDFITPNIIQGMVTHFFDNIGILTTIPNDLLQGKIAFAMNDFWRFTVNSTVGVGGLFDPATHFGLPEHYEDFGLTLAAWGAKSSYYLSMPLFGPSTFRDSFGGIFDFAASPWPYIRPIWVNYAVYGVDTINSRAQLLSADALVQSSFDPYVFVRDAYIQSRNHLISQNNLDYQSYRTQTLENFSNSATDANSKSAKNNAIIAP